MTVRISEAAAADLIEIYVTGAQTFGKAQAETYQDRLERAIELIGTYPELARMRSEITPPVRIHPVGSHIIVYLGDEDLGVLVLRVRHARENWVSDPLGDDD